MRTLLILCLAILPCLGCGSASGDTAKPVSAYATQGWSLVSAYERAHKEKNVERALALVHLGQVDVQTRDVLIKNLNEDFAKELVSAKLVPLAGDEKFDIVINDRHVTPNLKVTKRLRIELRSPGPDGKPVTSFTEYYVGERNGRDMIASSTYNE
ncbi:MAG: hypothetical protein IPJ19_20920 [Planctomycetes bacterium]|nr:hypothetical protein [Planctomycetota bacterium]